LIINDLLEAGHNRGGDKKLQQLLQAEAASLSISAQRCMLLHVQVYRYWSARPVDDMNLLT
jgi:hypothetical protein